MIGFRVGERFRYCCSVVQQYPQTGSWYRGRLKSNTKESGAACGATTDPRAPWAWACLNSRGPWPGGRSPKNKGPFTVRGHSVCLRSALGGEEFLQKPKQLGFDEETKQGLRVRTGGVGGVLSVEGRHFYWADDVTCGVYSKGRFTCPSHNHHTCLLSSLQTALWTQAAAGPAQRCLCPGLTFQR